MSAPEPPEKQTVKQTDELLRKSRRLIDELEFILHRTPPEPKHKNGTAENHSEDAARSE